MTLLTGLIITAFVLFFFEIFLPGGILAVAGGLLLLTASFLAYSEFGLIWSIMILFLGLVGALLMFFIEIRLISKTRFGRQLSLQSSVGAKLNPKADEKLVGQEGVTLTILAPGGKVEIEDKTYTASALDGYIEKGAAIRVVRIETFKIIVEKK